jgi:hypothetical protein
LGWVMPKKKKELEAQESEGRLDIIESFYQVLKSEYLLTLKKHGKSEAYEYKHRALELFPGAVDMFKALDDELGKSLENQKDD